MKQYSIDNDNDLEWLMQRYTIDNDDGTGYGYTKLEWILRKYHVERIPSYGLTTNAIRLSLKLM